MVDAEVSYCTRRAVQRELGYAPAFNTDRRIDSKIRQASRDAEGLCHRYFYPTTATRRFDMPDTDTLWLYQHELSSVTSIVSGTTTMTADDYILRPESGPPYSRIDVNWSGATGWQAADTWQRAIAITSETFGGPYSTATGPTLASSLNGTATTLTVSSCTDAGAGSLLLIGSERLIVTDEALVTTTATITAGLTASKADNSVAVSDGTLVTQGEVITIGSERMQVESVSGNTVTVTRSTAQLAVHNSGATIYAPRSLTVARGQLGTTAASHDSATQIYLLQAPSLVQEYVLGLTCAALEHGSSGFARTAGAGESQRAADDRGLGTLLNDVYAAYGRKARGRAVC